jgi:H+/Cl- antiporter ClcA
MAFVVTYFAVSSVLLLVLGVLLLLVLLSQNRDADPLLSRATITLILIGAIVFNFPAIAGSGAGGDQLAGAPTDFPAEDEHTIVSD